MYFRPLLKVPNQALQARDIYIVTRCIVADEHQQCPGMRLDVPAGLVVALAAARQLRMSLWGLMAEGD
jgi:hypothetical protein